MGPGCRTRRQRHDAAPGQRPCCRLLLRRPRWRPVALRWHPTPASPALRQPPRLVLHRPLARRLGPRCPRTLARTLQEQAQEHLATGVVVGKVEESPAHEAVGAPGAAQPPEIALVVEVHLKDDVAAGTERGGEVVEEAVERCQRLGPVAGLAHPLDGGDADGLRCPTGQFRVVIVPKFLSMT